MEITNIIKSGVLLTSLCSGYPAVVNAATVGIDIRPSVTTVGLGETFNADVYFTGDQFYAVSDIELMFDSSVIRFDDWSPGTGILSFSPTTSFPMSESAPFSGNLADTGGGLLLASVNFTAIDFGLSTLSVDPASFLMFTAAGEFDAGAEYNIADIVFTSAEVRVVPLPAAVWLFTTGLVGMFGFSRRKTFLKS